MAIWFTLLLLVLPVILSILKAKKLKLPPGPPKLPIIGNMLQILGGVPHQTLYKLSQKYGPIMQIHLGGVPIVVISSPEAAEKILKTHEANCCSRPRLFGAQGITYNYCDLGFSPYSDYYKITKKICNVELFSAQRVHSFGFIREDEIAFLMDSISQSCSSATPVNLSEMLLSFTANLTCKVAFGKSVREKGLNNFRYHLISDALQMIENVAASDFFPFLGWIIDKLRRLDKRNQRVFKELDSFCQKLLDDRLNDESKQKQQHEDVIDVLLKLRKRHIGSEIVQFTDEQIKALFLNMFLGGSDTSAITMIWAMTELIRNPNLMKKAQAEIRSCVGSKGKVSISDVDKLQYLKAVVKETLRLHPPGTIIPRETTSHFTVNGYNIYPKTHIQVNIWAIARDPEVWERPEEFIPERFMDSSIDFKGKNFEFLPFGAGRRMCPGIHMAINNIELTLANLLCCFDWKLPCGMKVEDIDMEEEFGLATHKKTALKLVPVKYMLMAL